MVVLPTHASEEPIFYFDTAAGGAETASFPYVNGWYEYGMSSSSFSNSWYNALTKYKTTPDRLHVTTSSVEGVGDVVTGVSLDPPEEIHPTLDFRGIGSHLNMDLALGTPTDDEIRPVNKAVRYMIKAK